MASACASVATAIERTTRRRHSLARSIAPYHVPHRDRQRRTSTEAKDLRRAHRARRRGPLGRSRRARREVWRRSPRHAPRHRRREGARERQRRFAAHRARSEEVGACSRRADVARRQRSREGCARPSAAPRTRRNAIAPIGFGPIVARRCCTRCRSRACPPELLCDFGLALLASIHGSSPARRKLHRAAASLA